MNAAGSLPRVGCGAVIIREGRLLLVRRRRPPEVDHWALPGGKVDPFEPLIAAVAREIDEELGLIIKSCELLCVVDHIDRGEGLHWVAPVYIVREYEGVARIREPEALSDLVWADICALPQPLTEATRRAVAVLDAAKGT